MIKLSDYVIKFIKEQGIKDIFAISGGGCIHLIDSIRKSNINYICMHHEQALAMAVEGYSRINKNCGVGVVTTGPGGANTLTGVLGCWLDSVPALFISGQVPVEQLSKNTGCRQVGDQEFDIVSVMENVTKYSVIIKDKTKIKYHLEKALHLAKSGRPGPVWIDIPLDLQGDVIDESSLIGFNNIYVKPSLSLEKKFIVNEKLGIAKKPLLVVGNGIRLSEGAMASLSKFLLKSKIPVVTGAHSGVDVVNDDYESYYGRIGVLGQKSSNKILQECDLLICIGTRLPVKMTGYNHKAFAKNAYKIIVDIDENEMNKYNINFDLKIKSDANIFIQDLLDLNINYNIKDWLKYCKKERQSETLVLDKHYKLKDFVSSYCFAEKLSQINIKQSPVITANGTAHVVLLKTMKLTGNQRLFTNVGCASMGYGLPASVGACFANDKKETICVEGDGSLQMNIQELQTVMHYDLPIKIFVLNNGGYLSIRLSQDCFFNKEYCCSLAPDDISFPNLSKIAKAYGIDYINIKNNDELEEKIELTISHNGPIICEVFTDPNEKHEPKVISKLNSSGKFEPGKLTDMQ